MKRKPILRLLFLEDLESDFELAKAELQRNKIKFKCTRVECKEAFLKAVVEFKPDIIISDYMMSTFTGMEALKLSLEFHPYIPFIILTGSMNEDTAVQCLRSGAADYVIKEHIARLPYSVKEILEQKELNREKERAEKALVESEKAYRLLFESNPQPMWVFEVSTLQFLAVNEAAIAKYGYSKDEFLSLRLTDILPSEDIVNFRKFDTENSQKSQKTLKTRHRIKDGSIRLIEATSNLINFDGKEARLVLVNDVTEKVQAEEELLRSEENFRRSLDESPLGIRIVSMAGKTIYANKAFLNIYEFGNLEDYNLTSAINRYTPDSYLQHQERKKIRKTGRDVTTYDISIVRKNSEIRHVKVSRKEVIWNGTTHLQVINQDITEQKNAEEKLRTLSLAVEQSPASIIITDTDANIEYVNPKVVELTGYSVEELIGQNPRIFSSHEKSKEEYTQLWKTIKSGNIWTGEFHNRKKSGELYWESAIISPIIDSQSEISHFLAIKEDITADKKILQDLILAKEKAEESDRLKSSFLANISHEIRTPMNSILGFAELLEEEELQIEEQLEYLKIIRKSGQRMLATLHSIVEISKIEAGSISVKIGEVNVNRLVEQLMDVYQPETRAKGLSFIYQCGFPSEELMMETDAEKVEKVISILLNNAIKFTHQGEVSMVCKQNGTMIEFCIRDTGIGLDPMHTQLIFERFRQVDLALNRGYEGAGLGLTIAKAYVEILGGKIWIDSELGKGTAVYFKLPLKTEHQK